MGWEVGDEDVNSGEETTEVVEEREELDVAAVAGV
jgi:hypothetical protein